jgi:hypothetical protein
MSQADAFRDHRGDRRPQVPVRPMRRRRSPANVRYTGLDQRRITAAEIAVRPPQLAASFMHTDSNCNGQGRHAGLIRFRKEFIPDVARRWRETNATRLTPDCLIDFLFVADFQATGGFRCDEDRVTHFPA